MLNTYKPFVGRMIQKYEGGYGWDKADTGGPTKYGVTCFDLAEHMGQKMDSMSRWAPIVKAMTLDTAEQIYAKKYAAAIRYNDLPAGIDVEMMDYGVNSGVSRPLRVARAILKLPPGARMDQPLLDALKKTDPDKFIDAMSAERLAFMHAIRGGSAWRTFGGGWGARVADLKAYAHHLTAAPGAVAEPIPPDLSNVSTPKAQHGDPKTNSNVIKGTTGTVLTTGPSGWAAGVPPELLAIGLGFIIVGGIGYAVWKHQHAAMLNATVVLPPAAVTA